MANTKKVILEAECGSGGTDPAYDIENWYKFLRPYTFRTKFLPLSKEEAVAIVHYYEETRKKEVGKLTEADKQLLDKLSLRIQKKIRAFKEDGIFVKLSSRSAKDAAISSGRMKTLASTELQALRGLYPNEDPRVVKMLAFVRASCFAMKITQGAEALDLLIRSQRIMVDLTMRLLNDAFEMNIVFRQWNTDLQPEKEFRAFLSNGKLTCITQYYSKLYVPSFKKKEQQIKDKLVTYFNSIQQDIPLKNYALDMALLEGDKVVIVELNPFAPHAGTSLFDWANPKDQEIVKSGPFEFRVLNALPKDALDEIYPPMRKLLDDLLPNSSQSSIQCNLQ